MAALFLLVALALGVRWWMNRPAPVGPIEHISPPVMLGEAIEKVAPKRPRPPDTHRAQLLAAIQARAGELEACGPSPARVPAKLRVTQDGVVRGLTLSPTERIPAPVAECVRSRVLSWKLTGVQLPQESELLVTFNLAAAR